ncbi:MAG: hypothetical protein IJV68_04155 [Clostridia bacterium]|nr:hypothetical protein [Clostridia bacterium]MBQ9703719.1 hypothetical protein [Clostridia bacterium]
MFDIINDKLPIAFQMALSTNPSAFNTFLRLSDTEQDRVISSVKGAEGIVEINRIVDNLCNVKKM